MEAVQKHVDEPPFNFSLIAGAGFCHDATWTLAYALNRTVMGIACLLYCYDAVLISQLDDLGTATRLVTALTH